MSEQPETPDSDSNIKYGITIWLAFCLFTCLWFVKTFVRGRRQFQNNLHVIEDGLKKMQDDLELKQRQKSIGCIENLDDITAMLKEIKEMQQTASGGNEKQQEGEVASEEVKKEEVVEDSKQDKKND